MKRNKAGFTLIELLVVIAIIAILAAILFPVFAAAKKRAKLIACLSNMKQVGVAIIMNANDHEDKLPSYGSTCGFAEYGYGGGASWTKPLKSYVKSPKVFRCPIDTGINAPLDGIDRYWSVFQGRPLWAQTGFAEENFSQLYDAAHPPPADYTIGDGMTEKPKPNTSLKPYCKFRHSPGTSYTFENRCSDASMTKLPGIIRADAKAKLAADPTDTDLINNPDLKVRSAADVEVCRDIWYWHLGVTTKEGNYRPKLWLDGHVNITQEFGIRYVGSELYPN